MGVRKNKGPFCAAPPAARSPAPPPPATPHPERWRAAQRAAAASPERPGAGVARPGHAAPDGVGWSRKGSLGRRPRDGRLRKVEGERIQRGLQTRRGVVLSRDTALLHARRPRGHARRRGPVGCTVHRTGGLRLRNQPIRQPQSNLSWRERAGAMGGRSAESFRWRRIFLINFPESSRQ
jgi:hypothetical protein